MHVDRGKRSFGEAILEGLARASQGPVCLHRGHQFIALVQAGIGRVKQFSQIGFVEGSRDRVGIGKYIPKELRYTRFIARCIFSVLT